jgi:exodeoxyribonuclease VII small subunit
VRPRRQHASILGRSGAGQALFVLFSMRIDRTESDVVICSGRARRISLPSMSVTPESPPSFEAALAELEALVATMEGGQLPLAQSLSAYKRGAELLAYCQAALKDAQQQVDVLESGVLKAFKPEGNVE